LNAAEDGIAAASDADPTALHATGSVQTVIIRTVAL
jgi:hypothetical protein